MAVHVYGEKIIKNGDDQKMIYFQGQIQDFCFGVQIYKREGGRFTIKFNFTSLFVNITLCFSISP